MKRSYARAAPSSVANDPMLVRGLPRSNKAACHWLSDRSQVTPRNLERGTLASSPPPAPSCGQLEGPLSFAAVRGACPAGRGKLSRALWPNTSAATSSYARAASSAVSNVPQLIRSPSTTTCARHCPVRRFSFTPRKPQGSTLSSCDPPAAPSQLLGRRLALRTAPPPSSGPTDSGRFGRRVGTVHTSVRPSSLLQQLENGSNTPQGVPVGEVPLAAGHRGRGVH
mmetsp:Transcript_3220/g.7601  ORF Transcript_3220/g.7601 Transcript_3220/m.7601 type:complete len:225 (+) Transcript_3220:371-1045(+)